MDKKMAGKIRTYLKGCFLGAVTMATILIFIEGVPRLFAPHQRTHSSFSPLNRFSLGEEGERQNDISPCQAHLGPCSHKARPRMILATTNSAFLDFTRNWLVSMKRSGVKDQVVIIAEDKASFETMRNYTDRPNLQVKMAVDAKSSAEDVLKFSSDGYLQFVNKRPAYILHFLKKGFDVLFSDVDIVLLNDPFWYFDNEADIDFQVDIWKRDNHNHSDVFCAGFVFYHATDATRQFLKRLVLRLSIEPHVPDQVLLNRLLQEKGVKGSLRMRAMEGDLFVSGRYYFNETWRTLHTARRKPVMIHNNWIKRKSDKLKRFKELDLWYL